MRKNPCIDTRFLRVEIYIFLFGNQFSFFKFGFHVYFLSASKKKHK